MNSWKKRLTGYYLLSVDPRYASKMMRAFLQNGWFFETKAPGSFEILPKNKNEILKLLNGKTEFRISKIQGLPSFLGKVVSHVGVWPVLVFFIALYGICNARVCDIRSEENTEVPLSVIESELESAGLFVGAKWKNLDFSAVENRVLSQSDTIGWIGIHKRGVVLYVSARAKANAQEPTPMLSYANIVSDCDGVVLDLTVKKGTAVVNVGDTVKKGDLLISGIVNESGTTVFTEAEGEVLVLTNEELSVFVPFSYENDSLSKGKVDSLSFRFFGNTLNIFKNSGKAGDDCVIIDKNMRAVVWKRYRLPVSLTVAYRYHTNRATLLLSRQEAEKIAECRLRLEQRRHFSDADLVRSKTETVLTDSGCTRIGSYTVLKKAQKKMIIDVE